MGWIGEVSVDVIVYGLQSSGALSMVNVVYAYA